MLTSPKIIQKIEQNRDRIRSFGVKKIALFGSYAKNEADSNSDLDFLVEFKQGRGLVDDYFGLQHLLHQTFNKKVDLVKKKCIREELKESILRGKRIEARL